ncbi:metallophosphoesterase [Jatrophihabitans sp. YIM 134969]
MTPPGAARREPGRVAVIGDVGGQLAALRAELARLGADPDSGALPDDLTVVQVGDLVHRGPDSEGVVALAEHYLDTQPGQWVQLVGNHEAQYLREPAFHWPERIGEAAALTLWDLWEAGRLHAAAAVRAGDDGWLVTHAGLTHGFWREALGSPTSPEDAARALDAFRFDHPDVLFHAGTVLGGGAPDPVAGPVWASAGEELVPSWLAASVPMPFDQLHGHSAMTDWRRGRVHAASEIVALTTVDRERAHEITRAGQRLVVGVDPRHGRKAHRGWEAFVLDNAVVTSLPPG